MEEKQKENELNKLILIFCCNEETQLKKVTINKMGRGRRGILNQSQKKGHHYCKRSREDDKILLLSGNQHSKKSGFEISEDFLAELRKMDQSSLANELLSISSIK